MTLGSLLSLIEPSYASLLSRLGDNISKSCAMNLQYVSLNSFHIYSHFFSIQAAMGQISFTLDTWSDQHCGSFLAVTAHWVVSVGGSSALQLKTALIAFHCLRQNHTGKSMVLCSWALGPIFLLFFRPFLSFPHCCVLIGSHDPAFLPGTLLFP